MSATNTENKQGDHVKHEGAPKQQQGNEQGIQNQNPNAPKNHDPKNPQHSNDQRHDEKHQQDKKQEQHQEPVKR
jgi:hypothetical protein